MTKNYMADVANMLGVELEEEFTVPNKVATLKISAKDGLMCKFKDNKNWEYCASYLQELLMGDMEIVKLPWKPKNEEGYYYPNVYNLEVFYDFWVGTTTNYAMYNLGMCYRTREEAEAHFTEDYKKLTGKDIQEDYEYINNRWTYRKNNEKEV